MKKALILSSLFMMLRVPLIAAQEADSGFDLRATLSGQATASNLSIDPPRSGSLGTAGFRSVLYPGWKLNNNWSVTGAWQLYTRPYFTDSLTTAGYGANGNLLQATLNYARVSEKGSFLIRAGELSTAFGSFPLRYDDASNALVDAPLEYGYYYAPVSTLGVAGAQIDATRGRWDGRVQFANSSPANPRSLFAHDQYGNWAGGGGYTIRQGFRIGVSGYRGPYLDRDDADDSSYEVNPSSLPAHAVGLDIAWARGHWNVQGELQKFVLPYSAAWVLHEQAGYGELKRVLNPRWYVAARSGYTNSGSYGHVQSLEAAAGFRPNRFQLIKVDYEFDDHSSGSYRDNNTLAVQFVTMLHFSAAER